MVFGKYLGVKCRLFMFRFIFLLCLHRTLRLVIVIIVQATKKLFMFNDQVGTGIAASREAR